MNRVFQTLTSQQAIQIDKTIPDNMLICSAPEIVRKELNINIKAVDIYQFAMIAYQILYRKQPFEDASLLQSELIALLKTLDYNGNPLRPTLTPVSCFDAKFLSLFESCWAENPSIRIGAVALKREIFSQTKKFSQNLMDHIVNVLETYTNNLEKTIAERTEKANEEKKRADNVLCQLLPEMVANALKSGHLLPPEIFEMATVCFTSVVSFKDVMINKEPQIVVDTLNMIYQLMDDTIARYDAYKLSREFRIPTIQADHLTLRIGLNSGPVAAGVVGVTLPKYCLFGDTVNVASRMESTGEADKIHISESLYSILETLDRYQMEKRGTVMVKEYFAKNTIALIIPSANRHTAIPSTQIICTTIYKKLAKNRSL
uniref:Guanylate cyclase n=1 Tax=Romanomermis culicivorax TaxID=13658 RepID=A0A915JHK5_ROMCU